MFLVNNYKGAVHTRKRKCPICGELFKPKHPNSRYCKAKCRLIARKRQLHRANQKRNQSDDRKDYMMSYMWEYRHHKYRPSALSVDRRVRGTDMPSVDISTNNIYHDSKLMVNTE